MTNSQKDLARHALGLPNTSRRSYRNRFVAGAGHGDFAEWITMVELGYANRRDGNTIPFGGDDLFWLTQEGARLALNKGEKLCAEDFPPSGHSRPRTDLPVHP